MKKTMTIFFIGIFLWKYSGGQTGRVGINTNNPQATLHIHGNLRTDSLGYVGNVPIWDVVCDTHGNFLKKEITLSGVPFLFGESIAQGDIVAIGDGRSGYMSANGDGVFQSNESCSNTRFVAQGFYTSGPAKYLRAIEINLPITSGATHHFNFYLQESFNGIPSGITLASQLVTFIGSATITGWNMIVFDPPMPVLPTHAYYLVMQLYVNTNTTRTVRTVNNSIASGSLGISTNSGATWTMYPSRDVEMRIYEIRHLAGVVYGAASVSIAETIRFDQGTVLATSGLPIVRDRYDQSHAIIGAALESGNKGDIRRVCIDPIITTNQTMIPGASYVISRIPGQVDLGVPGGSFVVPVGFAIDSMQLYMTH